MTDRTACTRPLLTRRLHAGRNSFVLLFLYFSVILSPLQVAAQDQPEYDEISVFLDIPRVGGTDIPAVIKGTDLYLPVTDLFDFLKIRNIPAPGMESITGFFINPEAAFNISRPDNTVRYQDKTYNLQPGDLIKTESNLYLLSSYYGKIFGLDCAFNFRSLSVTVNSKLELPLIREMRQEEMRNNLNHLKGEAKADTTIGRTYPKFKFGMADWAVNTSQEINGISDARLNLALGAMVAGGEATASLNYSSTDAFTEKQQYYLWRYVNNDFQPVRQVMAGKIATHSISSIFNPVIGIQLTNTPTTFRRSFGTYRLSDKTEPGWIVELYVNNELVDYVKADASGFFTFEVPLVYGNSQVQLKFFGPWGEERVREQNINIPFNFLPANTLEYNVGAGFVEDSLWSRFSRASVNYGVTRRLTIGGGTEYLSSVRTGPVMPYFNASLSLFNNLLLSGEYTFGVRAMGTLSYRLPSNLQFDLTYTKYKKGQEAIFYNYVEERKAVISLPLRIHNFSSYQRFTLYQIVLPSSKYTTGEWLFSGSLFGVNANLTTYATFIAKTDPNVYSNLALAFRFPAGIIFMPQIQYGYTQNQLLSGKLSLEKHIKEHAFLNLSYENNFISNLNMAEVGFRYDFSFAQAGLAVRENNRKTSFVQYARGSIINDRPSKYLGTDNRPNVGRGGIAISAYLDLNSNGRKDPGEPRAYGLNLHANGGRIEKSDRDSTIRILGLEPYTTCFIELDQNSFENISWRLPYRTMSVAVDPEVLKDIDIPVSVVGEATGHVSVEESGEKRGLGRIIVSFFKEGIKPAGKTLTENDGYFSFFGLAPGNYTVRPDTAQLKKLGMISKPEYLEFKINSGIEGEVVSSLDFVLETNPSDTTLAGLLNKEVPVIRKDTSYMIVHEVTEELVTITRDSYAIQLGAFRTKRYAEMYRRKLQDIVGQKMEIVFENGFYKVRILDIPDRGKVDEILSVLKKNGINEAWVISLRAKQQQRVLRENLDTTAIVNETIVEKPLVITSPKLSVQVGAFKDESRAEFLRKEISSSISKAVVVIQQNGFYKVRIVGFANIDELKRFLPALDNVNLHNNHIIKVKKPQKLLPAIEEPMNVEHVFELPREEKRDTTLIIPEEEREPLPAKEKAAATAPPTISLQVAVFHRKYKAIRAQRRISKKLDLPVDIVQKWDYYYVVIKGFHNRAETYKYYPELAGLGYPGITLIEEK